MTYLFIWTFVGAQALGHASYQAPQNDWRQLGGYTSGSACHEAARLLNISSEKHRCISTDGVLK
ncbi:MAG: hypothetical protein FD135_2354 [Comamonadaceae bacterium]|nr:MAG: hypothetical protein FD135_2354 [Comamonadaceae bacterium]